MDLTKREFLLSGLSLTFGALATASGITYFTRHAPLPAKRVNKFEPLQENEIPETEVFATKRTWKNFPIINNMHEWLAGNIKTVYVVSPEDFDTPAIRKAIKTVRGITTEKSGLTEALQYVTAPENQLAITGEVKSILDSVMQESGFSRHMSDEQMSDFAIQLVSGAGTTYRLNKDITKPGNDVAIITTPYANMTKQEVAAAISGLPLWALKNIPGKDADWRAIVIMHEAGHARHYGSEVDIGEEMRADLDGDAFYTYELKRANVKTADLYDCFQSLRAIFSVTYFEEDTHITNAAIQSSNESFAPKGSKQDFIKGLAFLHQKITERIGFVYAGQSHFAIPLHNILNFKPPYEGMEKIILNSADERVLREMLQQLSELEVEGFQKSMDKLSAATKPKIEKVLEAIKTGIGSFLAQHNPPLLYKTVAQLYDGELDDNPIAKQYAYEFLVGAAKYAPDHFKTADYADNNFIPPAFDENGAEVVQHLGLGGPG